MTDVFDLNQKGVDIQRSAVGDPGDHQVAHTRICFRTACRISRQFEVFARRGVLG